MTALITARPLLLNADNNIYTFWDLRSLAENSPGGPGVDDLGSFKVVQRQLGANMSVDVGVTGSGSMRAWVRGSTRGGQSLYLVDSIDRSQPQSDAYNAQLNDAVSAADASNPRIDRVVIEVLDSQHVGLSALAQIRVVPGTPTVGATLDNLTGAASVPTSCLLLADLLVPAASSSVVTANIRDRRTYPLLGTVPPVWSSQDEVTFIPAAGLPVGSNQTIQSTASFDAQQGAALMYLPRRIENPTKVRFKYVQGGTANTAHFNMGLYDASARKLVETGSTSYAGSAGQQVAPVAGAGITISPLVWEPGMYYVVWGNDAGTGSASVTALAAGGGTLAPFLAGPNLYGFSATGGITLPQTLAAFTDQYTLTSAAVTQRVGVPIPTLSVG